MSRGKHNNGNYSLEISCAYIHGRIEQQIETFADQLSISPMELAARVGTLLLGAGKWAGDSVPLRVQAGTGRTGAPEVEGGIEPHGSSPQYSPNKGTRKNANGHKITRAEMIAKLKKRKDSVGKMILKGMLKGKPTSKKKRLQKIYAERAKAKKLGLPLPPLPNEKKAA